MVVEAVLELRETSCGERRPEIQEVAKERLMDPILPSQRWSPYSRNTMPSKAASTRKLRECWPSCSAVEALERQEPFVNPTLANHALALLARLFRRGSIEYHGAFVNVLPEAG